MKLIVRNRVIDSPIDVILKRVQSDTRYLKDIRVKRDEVVCTCPFHKNGQESKPACFVLNSKDSDLEYGTFHCFACGEKGSLAKLIGKCYDSNVEFGKQWLIDNFSSAFIEETECLEEIVDTKKNYLEESVLENFQYDNEVALDYLINKRHIKKEIIDEFKIGFDKETNSITFPCWDEHGRLVGVFKRNIYSKFFSIPETEKKPVYLLNYVIKNGITSVVVCESQINALTLWGWGIPAIALFGTGSSSQYEILRKSGIRQYLLAFDGDLAGDVGANRFSNNIGDDVLVNKLILPKGKDVNDLNEDEFRMLKIFQKNFI